MRSRVVVLGRDADLWLCVSAIARALGPAGVSVVAVELPSKGRPDDISATQPALEAFHGKLGIQERSLLQATGGSFSLGQNCLLHSAQPSGFFHAWATYGRPIEGRAFFPCWLKAQRHGLNLPLQNFCLTAVAAHNGRMLLPDDATAAFGRADYGYHLQTMAYVGYLKAIAAKLGVTLYETQTVSVERQKDRGGIAALLIDGSIRIEGTLFVDATGEDALLIGRSLEVSWEDWQQQFGVDRVLSARAPAFSSIPPFAEIRTTAEGWTALYPTRVATEVIHAYRSGAVSDSSALRAAVDSSGAQLTEVSLRPVHPGVRSRVWEGNCIAVGGSACILDPIYDLDLHALQLGVVHLLSLFPVSLQFSADRAEYNRRMRSHYERVRDFQCAFYALSPCGGEFWRQARDRPVPESVAHKIATFRARGHIAPLEDETFLPESWQAMFIGIGAMPESWPPAIDQIAPERVHEAFRQILQFIKRKVLEQPTHDTYLQDLARH